MEVAAWEVVVKGRKRRVTVHETDDGWTGSYSYQIEGGPRQGNYRTVAKALGVGILQAERDLDELHRTRGAANPHWGLTKLPFPYGTQYTSEWAFSGSSGTTTNIFATFVLNNLRNGDTNAR